MTLSILLVDPDAGRRTRMIRGLEGTDCRIAGLAAGPDEAMRIAANVAPDVALVVATLGNGTGQHLTDRLSGEHGVPVVLVAAGGVEPLPLGLAAQAGVMGFLVDPIARSHASQHARGCGVSIPGVSGSPTGIGGSATERRGPKGDRAGEGALDGGWPTLGTGSLCSHPSEEHGHPTPHDRDRAGHHPVRGNEHKDPLTGGTRAQSRVLVTYIRATIVGRHEGNDACGFSTRRRVLFPGRLTQKEET